MHSIARHPGDLIVGCVVIAAIAVVRLFRPTRLYSFSVVVPLLDLVTQLLLVLLGFAFLFSPSALTRGLHLGTQPSWHEIAFALPLALLAYTGLETVANLAEEVRQPGRDLPRSLFIGIGAVVLVTVLIALVALSAFPAPNGTTELGTTWLQRAADGRRLRARAARRVLARARAARVRRTDRRAHPARRRDDVELRLRAARVLARRSTASCRARFGRLSRRSLHSPETVVSAATISIVLLIATDVHDELGRLPREPLQLRRARRVHGRAARGREAPLLEAGRSSGPFRVPLSIRVPRRRRPAADRGRRARDDGDLRRGDGDAHRRALRRARSGSRAAVVVYLLVRRGRGTGLLEHVEPVDGGGAAARPSSRRSSCR